MVKPIPDGFRTITPHMAVSPCNEAIEFYKKAFNAEEVMRMPGPNNTVMHSELKFGDSTIMICDVFPGIPSPENGSPVTIHLYVEDCDKVFNQAVEAGASVEMPPADMFWGDRYAKMKDPYGHSWSVATHIADPSPEEMMKAAAEMFGDGTCDQAES